ncbi:unnamed protein product [Linum trigynum]|uniref:Uncharacterized protein n=1 Tax=Linum trigynum TaxID=586398 RepID=A0AAV2DZX5_9ROSI
MENPKAIFDKSRCHPICITRLLYLPLDSRSGDIQSPSSRLSSISIADPTYAISLSIPNPTLALHLNSRSGG